MSLVGLQDCRPPNAASMAFAVGFTTFAGTCSTGMPSACAHCLRHVCMRSRRLACLAARLSFFRWALSAAQRRSLGQLLSGGALLLGVAPPGLGSLAGRLRACGSSDHMASSSVQNDRELHLVARQPEDGTHLLERRGYRNARLVHLEQEYVALRTSTFHAPMWGRAGLVFSAPSQGKPDHLARQARRAGNWGSSPARWQRRSYAGSVLIAPSRACKAGPGCRRSWPR